MDLEIVLKFLSGLAKNNNREWFEKNKPKYLEAKAVFDEYVAAQLDELLKFDEALAALDPKKLTFRIYRDVRFSKNKSPYKTNFGAAFSPVGKGLGTPGYYLHVEPGGKSFVAGGLYMPEAENLAKVRQEIDYNGAALAKILKGKKFTELYGTLNEDDKLKRPPKGYAEDNPYIEWLKLKSFLVTHPLKDQALKDKKILKSVTSSFKVIKPLNDFLREATVAVS